MDAGEAARRRREGQPFMVLVDEDRKKGLARIPADLLVDLVQARMYARVFRKRHLDEAADILDAVVNDFLVMSQSIEGEGRREMVQAIQGQKPPNPLMFGLTAEGKPEGGEQKRGGLFRRKG